MYDSSEKRTVARAIKDDIRQTERKDLEVFIKQSGEKDFRLKQVEEWIWKKGIHEFSEMKNIPAKLIHSLEESYVINGLKVSQKQISRDESRKYALTTFDGLVIESVLIPDNDRTTVCISTQVGCPMGCAFCATGKMGFVRNLSVGEIFDQVLLVNRDSEESFGRRLSNIVVMGMGEPLLNYENTVTALRRISDEKGLAFSPHRITLSTVGIPDKIVALANEEMRVNLAISLHSAIQKTRADIIPSGKRHDISAIRKAIEMYHKITGQRVTIEYVMLRDVNDGLEDAAELARFCKAFPVKINLLLYNSVGLAGYSRSGQERINIFKEFLENKNMIVNVRKTRGEDIDAACGQLANKTSR